MEGILTMRIVVVLQNGNPGQVEADRDKTMVFAPKGLQQGTDIVLFHEELLVKSITWLNLLSH
jgi:hypothetical protein